jgi:uncharacterized membrane protein (UPF0136 family)
MQTRAILVWAYGMLVAVGGVIGCAKVGSKLPSLATLVIFLSQLMSGAADWN